MRLVYHPAFLAGRFRAVVDALEGVKKPTEGQLVSLIGALSFLGRVDEAEAHFRSLERHKPSSPAITLARFFLGIGFTRKSDYRRARSCFSRKGGDRPIERFYRLQGRVFYCYYTGRFRDALRNAAKARALALRSNDLFARTIATDAYGQCRVVAGEIHHGLRLLEEARELALKLGNESIAGSIAVSLELHDAELGLSGAEGVARLERRLAELGTEDNYSAANAGLELARQHTLRGRFRDAAALLERVAPTIYRERNRRQEITLNLRLAELAFQRGDLFGARHFLRSLDRLLHSEADSTYQLAALGLGRKIALSEGREDEANELLARATELARDFGTTRDDNLRVRLGLLPPERENREDRIHCVLQGARLLSSLPDKLRALLEQGLVTEAGTQAGLKPGVASLAVLPQGIGLLARDAGGVHWVKDPLSSLQLKILRVIASAGGADKAKLVEAAWGYRYDPLRHDPMVYTALSALRRALGPAADWLRVTEGGYAFGAELVWLESATVGTAPSPASPQPAAIAAPLGLLADLNHRQLEILAWLRDRRFCGVGDCRTRFDVSEVTALRDLDGLRRHGLVIRSGKARATRYFLAEEPGVTQ